MVDIEAQELDRLFHALAHPTRRVLLSRLLDGERTVGALAKPFDASLAAISKHILVLEEAGLVDRTVEGRQTRCRIVPEFVEVAVRALDHYRDFWARQFEELTNYMMMTPDG